jgi:threonine dehydrogenase-like Zn-dependent dehydrogenase
VLGLGPIGALFAHVIAHRGAGRVVGVDRVDRRDQATAFGLDDVVVADSAHWSTSIDGADRPDVLVEAVGHQMATLQHAIEGAADEATIMYFGIPDSDVYPLDMERMVRKHLTLMAGGTLHRRRALARANAYLGDHPGLLESLITHVYPRADVQGAYDSAMRPARDRFKVVVDLTAGSEPPLSG